MENTSKVPSKVGRKSQRFSCPFVNHSLHRHSRCTGRFAPIQFWSGSLPPRFERLKFPQLKWASHSFQQLVHKRHRHVPNGFESTWPQCVYDDDAFWKLLISQSPTRLSIQNTVPTMPCNQLPSTIRSRRPPSQLYVISFRTCSSLFLLLIFIYCLSSVYSLFCLHRADHQRQKARRERHAHTTAFVSTIYSAVNNNNSNNINSSKAELSSSSSVPSSQRKHVQLVLFSFFGRNGLGAQTLHVIDAVSFVFNTLATRNDVRFCIVESKYWNYGCAPNKGWSCYFSSFQCPDLNLNATALTPATTCVELADLPVPTLTADSTLWSAPCLKMTTLRSRALASEYTRHISTRQGSTSPTSFIRRYARAVWQFNSHTHDMILALKRESLSNCSGSYVGVHIRRGDKINEVSYRPISEYVRVLRTVLKPGEHVFVASDDTRMVAQFRRLLAPDGVNVFTVKGVTRKEGHLQSRHNKQWLKGRYMDVLELVTEIELLKDSRMFIGTFSSNLARLIYDLRKDADGDRDADGKTIQSSISLDDRWEPGNAWRTFGKPYCEWNYSNPEHCERLSVSVK